MAQPFKSITIVGGGLAGLTLGIGLRQQGIPVTICEAGDYPRHRVCGEFISGQGRQVLEKLGLSESLQKAGAEVATTAKFVVGRSASPVRPLPEPALCLSRYELDAILAQQFRQHGGELHTNRPWREMEFGEGMVRATGRRAQSNDTGWRWFGLKVHARDVRLEASLEMHTQPDGYLGLTQLKNGEVNICGLFRRRVSGTKEGSVAPWREMLRGQPGTELNRRLAAARFEEGSFCSVAGLSLRRWRAAARRECCVGDAVTMIPPVTGNGMSMAFEAAQLAVAPLSAYSRGEMSWGAVQPAIARACDAAFGRRLAWARLLQGMMFGPVFQSWFGSVALRSDWLWRVMFERTR